MRRFFEAPTFPEDAEKTRLVDQLYWVFKVILFIVPLYLIAGNRSPAVILAMVGIVLSTLTMMRLTRTGRVRAIAFLFLFMVSLGSVMVASESGGVSSTGFVGTGFFVVLAAGLLLSWRGAAAFLGLFVGYGVILIWLESSGVLPTAQAGSTPLDRLVTFFFVLLATLGLAFRVTNDLQAALERLQTEIREREKAESARRLSEQRYRILAENLPGSAILLYDHDLRFVLVDGPELERTGYSKAQMEGRTLYEAVPADFAQAVEANMRAVLNGAAFSAELPYEDLFYAYNYVPLRDESGAVALGMIVARDITERKRLELELQRYAEELERMVEARTTELRLAKEQIEAILHHTRDAVALVRTNGDVQLANPAFIRLFGEQAAQMIEYILWSMTDEQAVQVAAQGLVGAFCDGQQQALTTRVQSPAGEHLDIDLALEPINSDEAMQANIVLSAHDITHIRELERLKERFLAYAVHDLSAPITGLSTRLYLLKRSPEKLEKHIASLESQVQHLQNLLEDLRTLSLLDQGAITLNRVPTQLNQIIQRVFDTYEPVALQKRQTLRLIADPSIGEAQLDDRKIERAIVNLVANAIQYTPEGCEITIRSRREADSLLVEVTDQGIGIKAEDQQRIFERFFRTDAARSQTAGTGLGLAIVKEIIELHGGAVTVRSEMGRGSTFTLRLPA